MTHRPSNLPIATNVSPLCPRCGKPTGNPNCRACGPSEVVASNENYSLADGSIPRLIEESVEALRSAGYDHRLGGGLVGGIKWLHSERKRLQAEIDHWCHLAMQQAGFRAVDGTAETDGINAHNASKTAEKRDVGRVDHPDPAMEAALEVEGLLRHCGVIVTEEMEVGLPAIIRRHYADRDKRVQGLVEAVKNVVVNLSEGSRESGRYTIKTSAGEHHIMYQSDVDEVLDEARQALSAFENGGKTNE